MKKVLAITFALLILLSGIHLTIDKHFCSGKIAQTKVSVTGEMATCGMGSCGIEDRAGKKDVLPGKHLEKHCCDDDILVFSFDNDYSPSFFDFKSFSKLAFHLVHIPASLSSDSSNNLNLFGTNVNPPGIFQASEVSLPDICVFRI
ncbi:MAG: hypothetical protein WCL21_15850 [Mariniphaga sp.]